VRGLGAKVKIMGISVYGVIPYLKEPEARLVGCKKTAECYWEGEGVQPGCGHWQGGKDGGRWAVEPVHSAMAR